jgi:carboxypeptidase C (cathepsin A)
VGWKVDARYNALSYDVGRQWDRGGNDLRKGAVPDLREAVAADPKLRVLIVHGWNDLSCPFMGSVLTVDQIPVMATRRGLRCGSSLAGTCFIPASPAARSCART